jgi:amidohydrolase
LLIDEISGVDFSSKIPNKMHACGHDGHTTMLLGAAKHLAQTREFDGTAVLIFQPAEEGLGGARKMIEEGLFEHFPCDEIFGMHNSPNGRPGTFDICKGVAMAGASFFDIKIRGQGSHAAMPQKSKDTIVIASTLVSQLQSIVSRNVAPLDTCVLSVTKINAGTAYNVIPESGHIAGTVRYFKDEVCNLVQNRMQAMCHGIASAYEVEIDSEDFSDMLKIVPGAYCRVGHTGTIGLHNPAFVLGQEILPIGASIMARVVEKRLPLS